MSPWLEQILMHALPIGLRLGGVLTFSPFFGSDAWPARSKAALVLVLTTMLYGVCPVPVLPLTATSVVRIALSEAVVGLLMGLTLQLVLEGAQMAGQLV